MSTLLLPGIGPRAFAQVLLNLGHQLVAVPTDDGLHLGVRCRGVPHARETTKEIMCELMVLSAIAPGRLHGLRLGSWKARLIGNRISLYWTGVEVVPLPTLH